MVYAYWGETKTGQTINFMDMEYHNLGDTVVKNDIEYEIVDIAEEFPISATEMYEALQDGKYW